MKSIPFEPGRIVLSRQGHDKGRLFMVVGLVDEKHVLIADGHSRKLEKPKKKQQKHLRAKPKRFEEIAQSLKLGNPLLDSDIRTAITAFAQDDQKNMNVSQKKEECALVKE